MKHGSARLTGGGDRSRMDASHAGVNSQSLEAGLQQLDRIREVLQELGFLAEADQECLVFLSKHLGEKCCGGAPFDLEQILLASADVYQQSDRQRQIRFPCKVLDRLLLAIF